MKTVVKTAVVDGLVSVLVLTGFSVVHDRAVKQVKAVNARAEANLAAARAASFTLRLDDPGHKLEWAMSHTTDEPMTPAQARLTLGMSVTVVANRRAPGAGSSDLEVIVRSGSGVLFDARSVHGRLYLRAGWSAFRRAAEAGEPGAGEALEQGARELGASSSQLAHVVQDVRAGKWLALDTAGLLDSGGGGFPGSPSPESLAQWTELAAVLHDAVPPHVHVRGLDSSGGRQTIQVDVHVKDAVLAVLKDLARDSRSMPFLGPRFSGSTKLSGLSGATVHAGLTIDHGHYSQLRVPLRDLFALDAHPGRHDPKPGDLGSSALVLDVNDRVAPVTAPPASQVSDVDLGQMLHDAFAGLASSLFGSAFGA